MKRKYQKLGRKSGVVALRLPAEIDEAIRYAAAKSGQSLSQILRAALCKAWGITPEPREQAGAGR